MVEKYIICYYSNCVNVWVITLIVSSKNKPLSIHYIIVARWFIFYTINEFDDHETRITTLENDGSGLTVTNLGNFENGDSIPNTHKLYCMHFHYDGQYYYQAIVLYNINPVTIAMPNSKNSFRIGIQDSKILYWYANSPSANNVDVYGIK